ncbi:MAG: S41 family peptidase [Prolixibacteraceae bacterium]|nr:S41 family peptidase [Prolixibacteraceae bacterium]
MEKVFIILFTAFAFSSCEMFIMEGDKSSSKATDNFEYLWNECNLKYSYFDLKKIDWDSIKDVYSPKIYDEMSDDSLFDVLGQMLNELKDGHVNLKSSFNRSFYGFRYKGQDNFEWRIIEDNYLHNYYKRSGPFTHDFIADGQVGYIRFGEFTGEIDSLNFDYVLERYKDTKGLILDLRENGGGYVSDVFKILNRFVDTTTSVYYTRIKSGPGHNDFTEPEVYNLKPYKGLKYNKKVAVLTDRGTFSAASFTSLATKAIPNMILIGDTTGGGLGLPNGGQLPNGWIYRFSITQALTLDLDESYENGVPPDIYAKLDWTDLTKDEIIERALVELLN